MFKVPEEFRIKLGNLGTDASYGNNGAFAIFHKPTKTDLFCLASDGAGWEHVSVSTSGRCPSWTEMCHIKGLFWGAEDCVIQYHPPESDYVNVHPYCLHLWRQVGFKFPRPPKILVG
jgi:hypothetical protein